MSIFSSDYIKKSLQGKSFGKKLGGALRSAVGSNSEFGAKEGLARSLAGKNQNERERFYKDIGLGGSEKRVMENLLSGQRAPTTRELKAAAKAAEQKKRVNIFMSRRSAALDEASGSGATGFETSRSKFVGGEVESRSRVSMVGREASRVGSAIDSVRKKVGFAQGRPSAGGPGFAKGLGGVKKSFAQGSGPAAGAASRPSGPPSRPLGLGR